MAILEGDIKLLESERMSDASDGGGRRTARTIPDGVAGNVFQKVSRVDAVYGRVNLRKVYGHVATANLDTYAGAHFIITDAPDNDRIHVTAFSTASDFDTRVAARDRIESYVIAGPVSRLTLYGRQLLGSQAVLAYQRPTEPLPEVGEVIAISNEAGNTTTNQQFVRITDVTGETRTFTDANGDFPKQVVTLKISAPLRYEFYGPATPERISGSTTTTGRVRSTTVADAARYFGIQPLSAVATVGTLELSVASVYAPLVPTTQRETPLSLVGVAGAQAVQAAAVARTDEKEYSPGLPPGALTSTIRLERAVARGTLRFRTSFFGDFSPVVTATGGGEIPPSNQSGATITGTVDHETGLVTIYSSQTFSGAAVMVYISYIPAASVSQPAHTKAIPITLATRGTVYAIPLLPIPAPGTLLLDYRALGKWYRLRDEGNGELVGGDAQYGTGTIDYVNGSATVTLGALPDVGSSIILSWGSPIHYEILAGSAADAFEIALDSSPVKPGTVALSWPEGVSTRTATDNSAGAITGDATGTINYQTGQIKLVLAKPIVGNVSIAYDKNTPPTSQAGFDFGEPIAPHSVSITGIGVTLPNGLPFTGFAVRDNGLGVLVSMGSGFALSDFIGMGPFFYPNAQSFGTVDYATGVVTLASTVPLLILQSWNPHTSMWDSKAAGNGTLSGAGAQFASLKNSTTPAVVPQTTTIPLGSAGTGLALQLAPLKPMELVPESLLFSAFGKQYIDRGGVIYTDLLPNGSGTPVGTVNYATGAIRLTEYPTATPSNFFVNAALGRRGNFTATSVFFRTAGSPLRPASFYVQVTAADGALLSGTSDQGGTITGPDMIGKIEQTMGVAAVSFGRTVTAAGNELEPWYDAANVVGGMIFKPREVLPGTLRYSAVVLSNLPLNADILGLDPTRLPSDGRAPIFRPADVAVIHHTDTFAAGTPTSGAVIDVGRTGLSSLWIEDSSKKKLDPALYTVDLAAGVATMASPLSLTGYTLPLSAKHRIEEMLLLSDVQINGQLSTSAPLLRTYPLGSYVSSALLFGDLQARVTNVFEQTTWTNVWQSTAIGDTPAAQYDDVNYPLEVLNTGTVTERWRIQFTTTTAFQVIGENLGVIATGSTTADLQPINSLTMLPYFTLRKNGWGTGWAPGNQLRFDTIGATAPIWLARTVLPGATLAGDSFDAQLRGDVD